MRRAGNAIKRTQCYITLSLTPLPPLTILSPLVSPLSAPSTRAALCVCFMRTPNLLASCSSASICRSFGLGITPTFRGESACVPLSSPPLSIPLLFRCLVPLPSSVSLFLVPFPCPFVVACSLLASYNSAPRVYIVRACTLQAIAHIVLIRELALLLHAHAYATSRSIASSSWPHRAAVPKRLGLTIELFLAH